MEYIYLFFLIIIVFIAVLAYQRLIVSNQKTFIKILPLLLFLAIPAWAILSGKTENEDKNIIKPIENFVKNSTQPQQKSALLENIIEKELENTNGAYAVAVKNLKTNEYYYYNENRKFPTASLYKLWVMGAVYDEIEKGNLSKEQNIGFDAGTINERLDIASESAEFTEGFVGNTVIGAINRMITISDNYSAHILYLTIGWGKVGDFLKKYELNNSSINSLTTTASDILGYFEKLYKGEIISKSVSAEMLEILKLQTFNDRLPKYLPEGTMIAHKTGELGAVKHDAGIVFSKNGDYIIILLSETNNQTTAAEIEANISEKVWEYFNN